MDYNNKINLGRYGNESWWLELVICSNPRILFNAADDTTQNSFIEGARNAVDAAQEAICEVCGDHAETDDNFDTWNGGRYGSGADIHGFQTRQGIAFRLFVVDLGDRIHTVKMLPDALTEIRDMVNLICDGASAAIAEVVSQILAKNQAHQ